MKLRVTVNGAAYDVDVEFLEEGEEVRPAAPSPAPKTSPPPKPATPPSAPAGRTFESPIPGNVIEINVTVGQQIQLNDTVLVIDAMKMNTPVASTIAGTVKRILVNPGDAVKMGQPLIEFE